MKVLSGVLLFSGLWFGLGAGRAGAAALTLVSDTLSTSLPAAGANHTLRFTLTAAVPPSGSITITPQAGAFMIPAGLDHTDVDLSVSGNDRLLGASAGATAGSAIGVTVATGTSGSLTFTLNAVDAIAAGSAVTVKIGTNATAGATGDQQIRNPPAPRSYRLTIETRTVAGLLIDAAQALVAVVRSVFTGVFQPLATNDFFFLPSAATTTVFENPDGTKFHAAIPADFVAFSDEVHFQVNSFEKGDVMATNPPPAGKSPIGKVYDIRFFRFRDGSPLSTFAKPLTFGFFYTDEEVSGIAESTLKPFRWDGSQWQVLAGSTVFPAENRVSVDVSQLSNFALMGDPVTAPAPPPPPPPAAADGGGGGGGGAPSSLVPVTVTGISGTALVSPERGGEVIRLSASGGSVVISLPVNFWTLPTEITLTPLSRSTVLTIAPVPPPLEVVSGEFWSVLARDAAGVALGLLQKPAVLTFRYTDAQVSSFDEPSLQIFRLDQAKKTWLALPASRVDPALNTVTASTDHLTVFALLGAPSRAPSRRVADLNRDGRVDLVDFSILLYNWGRPQNPVADLNADGRVDLVDFSILLYWWTG